MMTLEHATDGAFQALLTKLREQTATDSLSKLRTAAWEQLQQRGLPVTSDEVFRYVGLRKFFQKHYASAHTTRLTREAIAPHILPECQRSVVVFVNGHFDANLSCCDALPELTVMPLATAHRTYGTFLNNQWQRTLKGETDPWACINAALHPAGVFLYLPPKVQLERPIQILSVIDAQDESMLILPRYHLFVGSGSKASVVTRTAALSGQGYAHLPACDISVEDGAELSLTQLSYGDLDDVWHADALRATLKRDSRLTAVAVVQGGEGTRHDYRVALLGENGHAHLNGLALLDGHSEAHIHSWIDHLAPHCGSLQHFKNVLCDSSRASFEGKIYVHSEAQKTDAFQLNNNLLLSPGAQVNSKPNLEIFADDVKASHGSTAGTLDEEQLFYLLARGLDAATAHHILIQGFCRDILDKIELDSVTKEVSRAASQYIAAVQ
jgi:Fe-S cluster assembly protein SufD